MFTEAADELTSQRNVTSLVDMALRLQCPLAAAKRDSARITWQKRDDVTGSWRLLSRDSGRISVRPDDSGDLEFQRLLVSDAGFYRCSKTTTSGIDSMTVLLIVHGMTSDDEYLTLLTRNVGA